MSGDVSRDGSSAPADDDVPPVLVVVGRSMMPGLPPGARLRLTRLDRAPAPGDVVALRSRDRRGAPAARPPEPPSAPDFVVHRVVWVADVDGRTLVFHRGDAGGRVGVTTIEAVAGRAAGALAAPPPPGQATASVAALDALEVSQRRAFVRAQRRCRRYVALRHAATRFGLARARRSAVAARVAALARRLLLGA